MFFNIDSGCYGPSRYFKYQRDFYVDGPCFQKIFPFLVTTVSMAEVRQMAEKYLHLKIYMTYAENIFDYTEILCRNIYRYYVENMLKLCCYFKTNKVFLSFGCSILSIELARIL